jgi:Flp pilus assembly protein TadG
MSSTPKPASTPDPSCAGLDRTHGQRGSMAVELILVVVLVAFMCLAVGLGRVTHGRQLADQAAAAASRDAALTSSPGRAREQAHRTAEEILTGAGTSCTAPQINVDVTAFGPGGQVAVTIRCDVDLTGLGPAGLPATVAVTSTARTPLETYRAFSGGFGEVAP